jgi:hypothetical protein
VGWLRQLLSRRRQLKRKSDVLWKRSTAIFLFQLFRPRSEREQRTSQIAPLEIAAQR